MTKALDILNSSERKLAILIDPEKTNDTQALEGLIQKIKTLNPTFIFVGGSTVETSDLDKCISTIKSKIDVPVIIFPGSHDQINEQADAILFLSLLSGRNPDYLIGHQVQSAHILRKLQIETIATAYLLIDGGKNSSVAYVSQTSPIPNDQTTIAVNTAVAGEMLGFKTVFLDAGSGAKDPVPEKMIQEVKRQINVPLIIGGGLRSLEQIENAYSAGADLVVIGNKIEEDTDFLLDLIGYYSKERNPSSTF